MDYDASGLFCTRKYLVLLPHKSQRPSLFVHTILKMLIPSFFI